MITFVGCIIIVIVFVADSVLLVLYDYNEQNQVYLLINGVIFLSLYLIITFGYLISGIKIYFQLQKYDTN